MGEQRPGATSPGTAVEGQSSHWVQSMFAGIAPHYDFLNHLLSFNIDRLWRRALTRSLTPAFERPDARVLDLCCGTGDVLFELARVGGPRVIGADFCHPMLLVAQTKAAKRGSRINLFEGDALHLPIAEGALDGVSIAFGFRNLANYDQGLDELHRILRVNGILAILEFSQPRQFAMKTAYDLYSRVWMPAIGRLVSGSRDAYRYLPDSIRKFPTPDELQRAMEDAGFADVRYRLLTGGIAALHVGVKKSSGEIRRNVAA